MKKQKGNLSDATKIRQKAEERLKICQTKTNLDTSEANLLKLIHELEVHQVELEMQNEELALAKEKSEIAEEKYTELYDFAPSGYLSLSKDGAIIELNFVAANMLGKERSRLIKSPFSLFLSDETKPIFIRFLDDVFASKTKQTCELKIISKDNLPIYVNIYGIASQNNEFCLLTLVDITERKQAEQLLEESGQKYKLLSENISDGISLVEHDKLKYTSPGFAKLFGFSSQDEAVKQLNIDNIFSYIHPDDRERIRNEIAYVHSKQIENYHYEYRARKKNGTYIWIEDALNCVYDKKGKRIRTIIRSRDITEQKKAEQALKENENRLKSMEKIAHVGSYEINLKTGSAIWSDETFKIFELNPETDTEPTAASYPKFVHKDDIELLNELLNKSIETGQHFDLIYRIITASNKIKYVHSIGKVHTDENGKPAKMLGTFQDITDRQKAELALKENEQRLQSLVNIFQKDLQNDRELLDFSLEESIKLTNSKLGFICFYDNKTDQFSLYSWSKQAMKECSIADPQTIFKLENTGIWGDAVRERKPIIINDYNAPNPHKKGTPKGHAQLHKVIVIPIIFNNEIVAVIGVANKEANYTQSDVLHLTILMKNTWALLSKIEKDEFIKKQNTELTKLNQDKDKFMSILAHDLRNPFNALLGFSQLLNRNIHKYNTAKIQKHVNIISNTANEAYKLLEEILLWSRAQSGKIVYKPDNFNLHEVCKSIIEEINNQALAKSISIKCNAPSKLNVFTDINIVKTVLRNLVSNAIKFTQKKGTITLDTKEAGNELIVSVTDTGIGIEKEVLSNIFNIAFNDTTIGTNEEKGTGLGLQICKEFVEKMGGKIWVESQIGKGSVFYFTIPKQKK